MAANSCEMDAEATPNTDVVVMNGIEEATPNTNQSSQLCVDNLLVSRPRPVGSNLLARGGGRQHELRKTMGKGARVRPVVRVFSFLRIVELIKLNFLVVRSLQRTATFIGVL